MSTYVLGISAFYHDSSAVLLKNGEIIAAAQEERFSREKFDNSFPINAIDYCLSFEGISLDQINAIGFYEDHHIKFDRIYNTFLTNPYNFFKGLSKLKKWINTKFFTEKLLMKHLSGYKGPLYFSQHHMSHAISAFFPSPYDEATILIIDGVGEWSCTTIAHGENNNIKLIAEQRFPHSIGFLYSSFTQYLGFKVDSGEYKLMGLAPYGEPKFVDKIKKNIVSFDSKGQIKLSLEKFDFLNGDKMINQNFENIFGRPQLIEGEEIEQFHMDIAKSIQVVIEEIIYNVTSYAVELTSCRNLVMAGGVALNCVNNGKLLKSCLIDKLWVQPCSGDGGGALGAALATYASVFDSSRKININDSQNGSYLGPSFSMDDIKDLLDGYKFIYVKYESANLANELAKQLALGKVVGLFQGRMEYGPRALGARSIIADPRDQKMQSRLNLKIKFRESFRPFAPIVLEESYKEWFENVGEGSPYMLLTTKVLKSKLVDLSNSEKSKSGFDKLHANRSSIPAVTHVDDSARIQTISKERNNFVYDLLKSFEKETGCPVLINTSFNIRGEPIVCSPSDALRCFMNTNMDILALENYLLIKSEQAGQLVDDNFKDYLKNG
jgi:carbamoyltransferase